MKKILSILLVFAMLVSLAACGGKNNDEIKENDNQVVTETGKTEEKVPDKKDESKVDSEKNDVVASNDKEDKKKEEKPAEKPETTPEVKPEEKPAEKPAEKPQSSPQTLGTTLLADFKSKASSMGTEELANALVQNPAIKFMGGAMPVEEGLLSGFDNAEIKGFKSGAVFMPMIGSIAFIGYVFELDNAADIPAFISTLEKNANMRWNICVEAEEMVTGSSGNKVFFVMCPTSLEE